MAHELSSENNPIFSGSDTETEPTDHPVPSIQRPDLVEIGNIFDSLSIDDVLLNIAKTNQLGDVQWDKLKQILQDLLLQQSRLMEDKVQDEQIKKKIDEIAVHIIHCIQEHTDCPFTIQRLCELVINPTSYYKMYIKYLRAVEKVLLVTSYWRDFQETTSETDTVIQLEPHHFEGTKMDLD
ncbi:PPP4R2-domain-containing protein [Gilbertella persicaria]|uniref:PPP4R2-domain-containing protein n=1 Tax=Gilbertella persicaria TaxID=101096 RepID=UPI00221E3ED4|nr:PPP4R2-domain-containing protein [Gilbertella persicaria]KAI8047238.1 PPP4R2-domain-containing protein [Gilbertella persicaria]